MLSGIKTGKKKRKAAKSAPSEEPAAASSSTSTSVNNQSVADQLRQSLLSGAEIPSSSSRTTASNKSSLPHELLEQSGRIKEEVKSQEQEQDSSMLVGIQPSGASSRAEALLAGDNKPDAFSKNNDMSVDEMLSRNVVRLGKKRKMKANSNIDSDEEEHRMLNMMMPSEVGKKKSAAKQQQEDDKANRRALAREIAINDKQEQAISRCWWWLESSQFDKQRLLSLGNHVSLVMAPQNLSLTPGHHFYLVPIKHLESFAVCEEEVWDEIVRFQTSLRSMYEKEYKKGILFSETVLPSSGFTQTKMEVIPVKRKKWMDSELYFKSTLAEQADDFGTHNKPLSTKGKGLRRTIPAKFPYFWVEWDTPNQGVAQIIESSNFPRDFAADTIAGMTGADPIRFQRKKKFPPEQERQYIREFLEKWKKYDWTEKLDS